jgi:hypothetical protein
MYVFVYIIPVEPLVDGHDSVWKRIHNVIGWRTICIVRDNELDGQSVQDILEN